MIKSLLLAIVATAVFSAVAQSLDQTTTLWAKALTVNPPTSSITGNGQTTQGTNIALAADGSIYAFGNIGAASESDNALFGNDIIAAGSRFYNGSASPMTFALLKVSPDGTPQWCVYAINGDIASGEGAVLPTSDGGAVVVTKLRVTQGAEGIDPKFRHTGGDYSLSSVFNGKERRFYCPFVMKVDGNGNIEWTKLFDTSTEPQDGVDAEFISSGVSVHAAALDDDGNIYFAGNMRTTMHIDGHTITAHNIDGWNGDSQKSVGNAFLVKLDSNGDYVNHIVTSGEVTQDNLRCLTISGGRIYALMLLTDGDNPATVHFGGKSIVMPANGRLHMALACLDTDLNAQWLRLHPNTLQRTTTLQVPSLRLADGSLWLAAEAQIGLMAGGKDVNTGTLTRDGLLVKFDPANGEALDGITLGKAFSGFFDIAPCGNGQIYAAWFNGLYAPAMLGKVNTATLDIEDTFQLCSSTATAQNIIVSGNRLYAMLRVRGNVTMGDVDISTQQFACAIAAYSLPGTALPLDVNGDGSVDVGDVNTVLEAILSHDADPALDVNGDGNIDVGDVNTILEAILN